jgi:hypothetical protein
MTLEAPAPMVAKTAVKAIVRLAMALQLVSQAHGIINKRGKSNRTREHT